MLTSLFLHVSVIHVVTNMWFLYVFADAVEDALGHWWFLALYLLAGFFGGMAFIATSSSLPIPAVGASGAIAGVMAASLVMWPRARLKAPGILLLLFTLSIVYSVLQAIGVPTLFLGGPVLFVLGCLMIVFFTRQGGSFLVGLVPRR